MAETIVEKKQFRKKPNWLRVKLPTGENFKKVRRLVDEHTYHLRKWQLP